MSDFTTDHWAPLKLPLRLQRLCLLPVLFLWASVLIAQAQSSIWTTVERGTVVDKDTQVVRPVAFHLFKLDTARMVDLLWSAPHRSDKDLEQSDVIIEVPTPEGVMMAFRIVHFSIMEPGLQKRYPHFRSFSGIGVDNKNWSILLGWTGKGLHATVRTSSKTILIDPFNRGDKTTYLVAYRKDFRRSGTFKCETGANERRGVDERGLRDTL